MDSSIKFALKTGFLSFDSTRVSANDVGYPVDVAIFKAAERTLIEKRFREEDLKEIDAMWGKKLKESILDIPENWIDDMISTPDSTFINPQQ